MKNFRTVSDFTSKYPLYDRFVEKIVSGNDEVVITFDLSHCDDPQRNDDNKSYILVAVFQAASVIFVEGAIPEPGEIIGGEILKLEEEANDRVRIGIEWRLRSNERYRWTEMMISSPPSRTEETVVESA
jgi:hypothetical protein